MNKLAGRVALVTGAGRGIGRSVALKLAEEGARVVINDLDEAPLREVASVLEQRGSEAVMVAGSVTDAGFPDRFVDAALGRFGQIDILVNNAGYIWNSRIDRTTDEQWNAMIDVHLGAPFRILRRVVRHWKSTPLADPSTDPSAHPSAHPSADPSAQPVGGQPRRHRKIVNVSSISGTHGATGQVGYSAAKAGVVGLTLSLARELGPDRVNVNAVAFGLIETRLTQEIQGETNIEVEGQLRRVGLFRAALDDMYSRVPLRRGGTADEAAGAVVLLCLPEADYISGQVLEVDGGFAI